VLLLFVGLERVELVTPAAAAAADAAAAAASLLLLLLPPHQMASYHGGCGRGGASERGHQPVPSLPGSSGTAHNSAAVRACVRLPWPTEPGSCRRRLQSTMRLKLAAAVVQPLGSIPMMLRFSLKKVKVARTRLPSVRFRS